IEIAVSTRARSRPKRFLASDAPNAGKRRLRNARPGPSRFRVCQKLSARHTFDRSGIAQGQVGADAPGFFDPIGGGVKMSAIADQEARRQFASELDRNFSVIASAGSGKTR